MDINILSIGQFAKICGVSRQSLIFYDKIDLLKPFQINLENGYRYYSPQQIVKLREILLLRKTGLSLAEIKSHLENIDVNSSLELLSSRKKIIKEEIKKLRSLESYVNEKIQILAEAKNHFERISLVPIIKEIPERKLITSIFGSENVDSRLLRLNHMNLWNHIKSEDIISLREFGTYIPVKDGAELSLENAGVYFCLKAGVKSTLREITIKKGRFACFYKIGMPYETEITQKFMDITKSHGYEIGDYVIDRCLLDGNYHSGSKINSDFCEIQIPISER